jgi:hypothetical protein
MRALCLFAVLLAGCGSMNNSSAPANNSNPQVVPNATITGPYDLILTAMNGHGTTNIYTQFTQTGATFTGTGGTLACQSNDPSQCQGQDASGVSITPNGTVSGANVTIVISLPATSGADTVTMTGTATGTSLAGTYTGTVSDSGTWTAVPANPQFSPMPNVTTYSGTFNSTANPLPIGPTILMQLGLGGGPSSFDLTGNATITNSPCISSLSLSGQAIGDAFSASDATKKASLIVLPVSPGSNNFNFSYKFDSTAPSCAGDFGVGALMSNYSPWDY